jgi:Superinfection immunity protein
VHALYSIVIVFVLCDMALACAALYLLPVLIGWRRRVPDIGSVAVINILLGWTLIGWVAALAMAFRSVPPSGPPPRHLPPPGAGAGWASGPAGPPASRPGSPPPLVLPPRPSADQQDAGHAR